MKITDIPSELVKYFSQAYEIGSKGKTGTSEVVVEEDTEEVDKVEDSLPQNRDFVRGWIFRESLKHTLMKLVFFVEVLQIPS